MGCGSSSQAKPADGQALLQANSEIGFTKDSLKSSANLMKGQPQAEQQPSQSGAGGGSKKAPPPPNAPQSPTKSPKSPSSKPYNRAKDRIDAIDKSRTIDCGGIKMTYAYLSQRGFYPDDPFKANQDAYAIKNGLLKGKMDALFAVFDGHGKDGDGCAIYAKRNLPTHVSNLLERTKPKKGAKNGELNREQIQTALLRAHVETNKGLHKNPNIDDTLSGTTAISCYFHGFRNRITISNVGDSRAIIGQEVRSGQRRTNEPGAGRSLKAFPLSRDQTPYRKDEKARVKAAGARVLSLDQLEGLEPILEDGDDDAGLELGEELDEGGDPPRVWAQSGDYPGTAFTRSIGDSVAEELGVFAEPEMLTREVTPEDKIIVLASDGVFEFLTNQSVIDICAKFTDPLEACRAVVAEAYELWLQYELRTDDITIICIFIHEVKPCERRDSMTGMVPLNEQNQVALGPVSDDDVDNKTLTTEGLRPVRKHASKETSKALAKWKELGKHTIKENDADFDWKKLATEKTDEEKRSIANAIKASVMFRNVSPEQREMIFACMESVDVKKGTWVIKQGTVGDRFYIVDEGQFEVRIIPDGQEDDMGHGGNIVHVYEGSRAKNAHPTFGELALVCIHT